MLTGGSAPVAVIQSLLESSAAVLRRFADVWQAALDEPVRVVAVGGGVLRDNVLQLKTNIVGRPVSTLAYDEGAAVGALRLAAMAVQALAPPAAASLFANPIARTVWPSPSPKARRAPA
jgi:sugar (pentulose or hexulose) kinase